MGGIIDRGTTMALSETDIFRTMDKLDFSKREAEGYFDLFTKMDADSSGKLSVREFSFYYNLQHSRFIEEVFRVFDLDKSKEPGGAVDFDEFFLALFQYCTYTKDRLMHFVFTLFDADNSGEIDIFELQSMVVLLFGEQGAEKQTQHFLDMLDVDHSGAISYEEFCLVDRKAQSVMRPAFALQETLQQKCKGKRYWARQQKLLVKLLAAEEKEDLVDLHFDLKVRTAQRKQTMMRQNSRKKQEKKAAREAAAVKAAKTQKENGANDGPSPEEQAILDEWDAKEEEEYDASIKEAVALRDARRKQRDERRKERLAKKSQRALDERSADELSDKARKREERRRKLQDDKIKRIPVDQRALSKEFRLPPPKGTDEYTQWSIDFAVHRSRRLHLLYAISSDGPGTQDPVKQFDATPDDAMEPGSRPPKHSLMHLPPLKGPHLHLPKRPKAPLRFNDLAAIQQKHPPRTIEVVEEESANDVPESDDGEHDSDDEEEQDEEEEEEDPDAHFYT